MKLESPYILMGVFSIMLLFLYIKHQNNLIDLSYKTQKAEQAKLQLEKKRQLLEQELLQMKSHDSIKTRAETELGMQRTKTAQIRYLNKQAK